MMIGSPMASDLLSGGHPLERGALPGLMLPGLVRPSAGSISLSTRKTETSSFASRVIADFP